MFIFLLIFQKSQSVEEPKLGPEAAPGTQSEDDFFAMCFSPFRPQRVRRDHAASPSLRLPLQVLLGPQGDAVQEDQRRWEGRGGGQRGVDSSGLTLLL